MTRRLLARLVGRCFSCGRALRGFLAGFTGMPAPRLASRCPHEARHALAERAGRRPTCC